jgi:hypothetical protein
MAHFMKKNLIAVFLLALIFNTVISQTESKFKTIEKGIRATLSCIEKQDTNCYTSIISFKTMMTLLESKVQKDSSLKEMYNALSDDPKLFDRMFNQNFLLLNRQIRKKLKAEEWKIKFKDYKIENLEKDTDSDHITIKVNILINDQNSYLRLYLTKHKGKYYIIEPVETYLGI